MEIGQRVRIKPVSLEGFRTEIRRECGNGRIGVIAEKTGNFVQVLFPQSGRMKAYRMGFCHERWLEVVEEDVP